MIAPTLKRPLPQNHKISYSVIIPAYNEERLLPATLAGLRSAMDTIQQQGEIIVVDNRSTDNTAHIARTHGATVVSEPFRQIARARNSGARSAKGAILVFLDADTIVPPALLRKALALLAGGACCGGGTLLTFDAPLPFLADNLTRFWNWLSKTSSLAAGSFIFCPARAFQEIGGFDERTFAGEELFFSRKMKAWGQKRNLRFTIIDDVPVITSSRKFHWYSSLEIVLLLILFTVFPFAMRSRLLCSFWYRRPEH